MINSTRSVSAGSAGIFCREEMSASDVSCNTHLNTPLEFDLQKITFAS